MKMFILGTSDAESLAPELTEFFAVV